MTSKTPEELAHDKAYELGANNIEYGVAKEAFLAGYQAAKDQLANVGKEIDQDLKNKFYNNGEGHLDSTWAYVLHLEKLAAAPQWISVKDRLPPDAAFVLVNLRHSIEVLWYGNGRLAYDDGHELPVESCTHWMPLPQPPKEEA